MCHWYSRDKVARFNSFIVFLISGPFKGFSRDKEEVEEDDEGEEEEEEEEEEEDVGGEVGG